MNKDFVFIGDLVEMEAMMRKIIRDEFEQRIPLSQMAEMKNAGWDKYPELMTTQMVLEAVPFSRITLYHYVKKGKVALVKLGGKNLYRKEDIKKLIGG